jgi:hypothetical protein
MPLGRTPQASHHSSQQTILDCSTPILGEPHPSGHRSWRSSFYRHPRDNIRMPMWTAESRTARLSSIKGTYPNSTFLFPRLTMLSLEFAFEPLSLIEKIYAPLFPRSRSPLQASGTKPLSLVSSTASPAAVIPSH